MSGENLLINIGVNANLQSLSSINREFRKLESGVKTLNSTLKSGQSSLEDYKNKQKLLTRETELQAEKMTRLKAKIQDTNNRMQSYKQQQEELRKSTGNHSKEIETLEKKYQTASSQLNGYEVELSNLEQQFKSTTEEIENCNKVIENFSQHRFSERAKEIGENLSNMGEKFQNTGEVISNIGGGITATFAPLAGATGLAIKQAVDFESAWSGVLKTVNGDEATLSKLQEGLIGISERAPVSANELFGLAEIAGQLGVEAPDIEKFVETISQLGVTTNISAEQGAQSLAQFLNITGSGTDVVDRLASAIVDCGNNFSTTENDILNLAMRLAGVGSTVGLTEAQIIGLSTAMSSLGITAEAGGTAISTVMSDIDSAVSQGGEKLDAFAKVAGMSGEQFKQAWEQDASQALVVFLEQLHNLDASGADTTTVLSNLFGESSNIRDVMLRLAGNTELVTSALQTSNTAWNENSALSEEAAKRYSTTASQMEIMKNKLVNIGVKIGQALLPAFNDLLDSVDKVVEWFGKLDPQIVATVLKFGTLATGVGIAVTGFGKFVSSTGKVLDTVGKIATGIGNLTSVTSGASSALSGIGSAAGTSTGALSLLAKGVGLLSNPFVLATTAAIALGTGIKVISDNWKETQKELDKGEDSFKNASANLEDFTGKIRTCDSWITQTFGKDIEIKFSAEFEGVKQESEEFYNGLNERLKSYYEEKWNIDHDGCEDEEEHEKHRQEIKDKYTKLFAEKISQRQDYENLQDNIMNNIMTPYLTGDMGMSNLGAGDVEGEMSSWIQEKIKIVEEGENEIYRISEEGYSKRGYLTQEEEEKIKGIEEKIAKDRAIIHSNNAEDIFAAWKLEYVEEEKLYQQSEAKRNKYLDNVSTAMAKASEDICGNYDKQIESLKQFEEETGISMQSEIDHLEGTKRAVANFSEVFGRRCQESIDSGDNLQKATGKAFASIVDDLRSGKINAQEFGLSNTEYMAMAIDSMIAGGASADELAEAINCIPKDKRADVLAKVQGKDKADELKAAIDKLHSKDIQIRTTYIEEHKGFWSSTQTGSGGKKYGYKNGVAGYWEQGTHGELGNEQVAYINELARKGRSWELVEGNVKVLGRDHIGTKVLAGIGASVHSNVSSVAMMKEAVAEQVQKQLADVYLDYGNRNSAESQLAFTFGQPQQNFYNNSNFDDQNIVKTLYDFMQLVGGLNMNPSISINPKQFAKGLTPYIDRELEVRSKRR